MRLERAGSIPSAAHRKFTQLGSEPSCAGRQFDSLAAIDCLPERATRRSIFFSRSMREFAIFIISFLSPPLAEIGGAQQRATGAARLRSARQRHSHPAGATCCFPLRHNGTRAAGCARRRATNNPSLAAARAIDFATATCALLLAASLF